jgi:hypothetical protein
MLLDGGYKDATSLSVALTRIKAKLAKFKHCATTEDNHESHPLKGNRRTVHKTIEIFAV